MTVIGYSTDARCLSRFGGFCLPRTGCAGIAQRATRKLARLPSKHERRNAVVRFLAANPGENLETISRATDIPARTCVRLVFCLYAEDAEVFPKDCLRRLVEATPANFLRTRLADLFRVLDTPLADRDPYLEPELAIFPYTNGDLFRSHTETMPAALNAEGTEIGRRGEEESAVQSGSGLQTASTRNDTSASNVEAESLRFRTEADTSSSEAVRRPLPLSASSSASPRLSNLRVKNNTPAAPAKTIYDGEAQIAAANINPYLIDAPNVFIENRGKPPAGFPTMTKGSQPTDGGNLILSPEERDEILANHPEGVLTSSVHMAWMRVVAGRLEMRYRYTPAVYNNFPWPGGEIIELSNNRIIESAVAEAPGSAVGGGTPTLPNSSANPCESVKSVASKNSGCRSNHNSIIRPFDYSIIDSISATAQSILSARALYPDSSLADLYDPLTMPPELRAAHVANEDKANCVAAAEKVEDGMVSVWPNGAALTDFMGGSRGQDPFSAFVRHQEERIVLLSTGGTLTSLAESGSGTLARGAQMEVWREIVARDAVAIEDTLQRNLVIPFLERAFSGKPIAVDLSFDRTRKPSASRSAAPSASSARTKSRKRPRRPTSTDASPRSCRCTTTRPRRSGSRNSSATRSASTRTRSRGAENS